MQAMLSEHDQWRVRAGLPVAYKWVVDLTYGKLSDTKLVRATTKEIAIETARDNSDMPKRAKAAARPATPDDLGCVQKEI